MYLTKKSFTIFLICIVGYIVLVFTLKDRNDTTFLLYLLTFTGTFMLSLSRIRRIADKWICFLFPIMLSFSKVIWIAHPHNEAIGMVQIGAGLYFTFTDIIFPYFIWRVVDKFKIKNTFSSVEFVYVIIVSISILFSTNVEFAFFGALFYLKCFVLFLWFVYVFDFSHFGKYLMRGLECGCLFQGIVAILQKIKNGPIGLNFLGEAETALRYRDVGGVVDRGASGTFSYSSHLAIYILFALLFLMFNEKERKYRMFFLPWCMIILYFAASRTAIAVLLGALIYGVWKRRSRFIRRHNIFYIVLFSPIVVVGGFVAIKKYDILAFLTNSDMSYQFADRLTQWALAFRLIADRGWILGYGINNYTSVTTQIGTGLFMYLNPVHNNYILNWFELGLVGAIIYILIFIKAIYNGKSFKKYEDIKKSAFLFIICVLVYNVTGWAFATVPCIYFMWVSLGILKNKHLR